MRPLPLIPEAVNLLTESIATGRFSIAPDDPREKWEAADQLLRTYFAQESPSVPSSENPPRPSRIMHFTLTPFGKSEARMLRALEPPRGPQATRPSGID